MPSPYGTFTKSTYDFNQPKDIDLNQFVLQLVTDAVKTSSITELSTAYVAPYYMAPNFEKLKSLDNVNKCLITVAHDSQTQALYPEASINARKTVKQWLRPYVINTTIKNSPISNNEVIYRIHDELIDLLTLNNIQYTNDITQPVTVLQTETYVNRPQSNLLLESTVLHDGYSERPSYLISSLTILFKIYQ